MKFVFFRPLDRKSGEWGSFQRICIFLCCLARSRGCKPNKANTNCFSFAHTSESEAFFHAPWLIMLPLCRRFIDSTFMYIPWPVWWDRRKAKALTWMIRIQEKCGKHIRCRAFTRRDSWRASPFIMFFIVVGVLFLAFRDSWSASSFPHFHVVWYRSRWTNKHYLAHVRASSWIDNRFWCRWNWPERDLTAFIIFRVK